MTDPKADMGDTMADYWHDARPAMREASRQRRAYNRAESARVLTEHGVAYVSKNDGAHLVVTHFSKVVDFWPGTGVWHLRTTERRGRGVFHLLRGLGITPLPSS